MRKRRRNWPAILADAQARGESQAALARRLNVSAAQVLAAQRRYGVALPRAIASPQAPRDPKVAAALRAYLDARGLTTAEIAREWGVPRRTVEGWLAGRRPTHPGLVMAAIRRERTEEQAQ